MAIWHQHASIAYLAVMAGVVGHATSEFVAKISGVAGPELSVWRFLLGGFGLVAIALLLPQSRNLLAPFRTHGLRLILLSFMGVTVGYLLFHWSLDFASVPQVATMVTTIPILVGLANLAINKQPFSTAKIISGIAAVLGVALLITDGYLARLAGTGQAFIGVLMALGCAATIAVYTVLVRPIIAEYGAIRITAITMFLGAMGLWVLVDLFWGVQVNPLTLFDRPTGQVGALLTISLYNTTITQFLWIGGLAAVPDITRGSYLFFFKPVIAACLAVWFLSAHLTAWQLLAIAVICAAVLLEVLLSRKSP
jgi:drug/metabolite transporter (DMT)-like permease